RRDPRTGEELERERDSHFDVAHAELRGRVRHRRGRRAGRGNQSVAASRRRRRLTRSLVEDRTMITIRQTALAISFLLFTLAGVSPAADVDQYGDALPPGAVARLGTRRLQLASVIQQIAYS